MQNAYSTRASPGPDRILIIAPAWIGDMVMAHTLVQLLRRRASDVEIHMLAPPATAPLARRMPGVAESLVLDAGHGQARLALRRTLGVRLRNQRYRQAIVLPNTFKSALIPWWARVPVRTGWHGETRYGVLNDRRRLDANVYPLMIERFMALGLPPGVPLERPYPRPRLAVDMVNRRHLIETFGLHADARPLALCPGAEFGPAKRWPVAHYAAVARHALASGRAVWLLGSPGDAPACAAIRELAPGVVDLAGRTSLLDAVDLLSAAEQVVCNDSGLMHVAGAVGASVVALFGSTSPGFTPPLGEGARVLELSLPCRPCFQRQCPLGHLRCLRDLTPARVLEAL
jgi:heptosyltransferase II